jgi:hypothetical protein
MKPTTISRILRLAADIIDAEEQAPAPAPAVVPDALYLAIPAYAKRLGVGERTAWSWAAAGMPCIGSGRTRRVVVREADAWLSSRRDVVDDAVEKQARASATRAARGAR